MSEEPSNAEIDRLVEEARRKILDREAEERLVRGEAIRRELARKKEEGK